MLIFKLFPFHIDIIVGKVKSIHNIYFVCTVEYRCGNIKAKRFRCQGQVDFQYLSNVHTRRHTQRIQYNIKRTSVRKIRHIFYRKHTGNNTLIPMTACHLIANGNLPFLGNINADCLIYPRRQFIAVFPRKYFCIYHNPIFPMRYL